MPCSDAVPTFGVRFRSRDDFLIEYVDFLKRSRVRLPLPEPLPSGTHLRLRIRLPTEVSLFVTGVTTDEQVGGSTVVMLDPWSDKQLDALQRCVEPLISPSSSEPTAERVNVLLVDDSVTQRVELAEALRRRGLRVRAAENGLLALSQALKRPPDIVLTDVHMPQMDGWSLLRAIRQSERLAHVPVVFFTALTDEVSRLRGYRMGVDDFLPKSLAGEEILVRLESVIARRRRLHPSEESRGLRGDLEHVRLGSLMAFLESERRTGALRIRCADDRSTIFLESGALVHLENLGQHSKAEDRVFELLNWSCGGFEFIPDVRPEASAGEATPLSYLLMEHARRSDEAQPRPAATAIDGL